MCARMVFRARAWVDAFSVVCGMDFQDDVLCAAAGTGESS
jgi:hypothetical protein